MLFYLYAGEKPDSGRMNLPEMPTAGAVQTRKIFYRPIGQKRRDLWSIQSS